MTFRVTFVNGAQLGPQFRRSARKGHTIVARSVTSAAYEAASIIRKKGAADIARAGRFGSRWQRGLITTVSPPRGQFSVDASIAISHELDRVGFRLFEFGGVVRGKPLLWIPLSFARDAQGVRARDYPGRLFRVDRVGRAPLLLSDGEPKYFGKESVRIPRKFHIRDIGARVARGFRDIYNKYVRLYKDL